MDTDTGEFQEKRLGHSEEAETFYRGLVAAGHQVRVGMEASGHARWFERLLAELQFELWIGDAAKIRSKRVRKQKTDVTPTTPVTQSNVVRRGGTPTTRCGEDLRNSVGQGAKFSEPFADNPAPNKLLPKLGFKFIKRYSTTC
jgi:hypothetical protein